MEFFMEFGLYFACMLLGFTAGMFYAYHEYNKWELIKQKDKS